MKTFGICLSFVIGQLIVLTTISAQTFNGQGGLLVPPGAPIATVGITQSVANVSGIGIIGEGCTMIDNVTIDFQHTWVGDVALLLIAPTGQVLELSSANGGSGDNFIVTVFTDNAAQFITAGTPPFNGMFRPEGRQTSLDPPYPNTNPLGTFTFANTFDGINADGNWILYINDFVALDVGVLNNWSITFTSGGGPAPEVDLGPDITICPGEMTTLTANVTPGATDYLWSTNQTTQSISVSPNTTTQYIVTVTNNGCIDFDTILVNVNPNGVNADAGTDVSLCQGDDVTLTGTGGGPGANYAWSNGANSATTTVSPTGTTTYTLTVTDGGCDGTDQVTVNVNPIPNANAGSDVTICDGTSISLNATGGTSPGSYQWSTGQNGSTISVNPVITTTYTVTVTVNGCAATDDVQVIVEPAPDIDAGPDEFICSGEQVTLTANGDPGTYTWSTGQTGPSITVSPAISTTYTVTLTNGGCIAEDEVEVNVTEVFADAGADLVLCEGESANLFATGGQDYAWSNGTMTQTNIVTPATTTTYTVTVTTGGCSEEDDVTVQVLPVPNADAGPDQLICSGEVATLTATGGGNYSWSNGQNGSTISVTPITSTTYTVTVSNGGCETTDQIFVEVNPTPVASAGSDMNLCEGESTELTASGGGTYTWSTGDNSASINVTPASTTSYTVTVTSAAGCSATDAVAVTVNPFPVVDAGPDQLVCEGTMTTLTGTGGTGTNSYSWSTGQNGSSISITPDIPGSYFLTVTVNGCSAEDEVFVDVLPTPVADAGEDQIICSGESVQLTGSGGANYQWSNGQTTPTINVSPASTTNYFLTVTNADGCTSLDQVEVFVSPAPPADAGPDFTICAGESVTIDGAGGSTYLWSTGESTATIEVAPGNTTTYALTVTDANGCTGTDAVTVNVNPVPVANAGPNVFIVNGESTTLIATGGGTYLWSTGESTSDITVTPDMTTTYTVTVTSNGCTSTDQVTVFVNEAPQVDLGPDLVICLGETAVLNAEISGPFSIDYTWNNGETTPSIIVSPTVSTEYSVTVTDSDSGLSSVDTIGVTVIDIPVGIPSIQGEASICTNSSSSFTIDPVSGATSYQWSLPTGATILSGQGTTSITVDWAGSSPGLITVVAVNTCGMSPATELPIEVESIPPPPLAINGNQNPCALINSAYSVDVSGTPLQYNWVVSGGAMIVSGQGTGEIIVDWNGSPGGDICLTSSNDCGESEPLCIAVMTTTTPTVDAGPDLSVCGNTALLEAVGDGTWSFISGPETPVFSDMNDPASAVDVNQPGIYTLNWAINENGCEAEDEVIVEFFDQPETASLSENCNSTNDAYAVSFTISGGTGPYSVNGDPLAGVDFTSVSINSGDAYTFLVTDANGCTTEVAGLEICDCASSAGSLPSAQVDACIDEDIALPMPAGIALDLDDVLGYALHDGSFPGGIINILDNPTLSYDASLTPETVYYITAFVGSPDGSGVPDLNDACLDFTNALPVVFHALPEVIATAASDICAGECTDIELSFTGNGPFSLIYSDGTQDITLDNLNPVHAETVCPVDSTSYTLLQVGDAFCSSPLTGEFAVNVIELPNPGVADTPLILCEGAANQVDLADLLSGEDSGGVWEESSAIPSTGGAFNAVSGSFITTNQEQGIYTFDYILMGLSGCPSAATTVQVEIAQNPIADAGENIDFGCDQSSVMLGGSNTSSGTEIELLWQTADGEIIAGETNSFAEVAQPGTYILQVTNFITQCLDRDTVEVLQVSDNPETADVNLQDPACTDACDGLLSIDDHGLGFSYSLNEGGFGPENMYQDLCAGEYNLQVMDSYGCLWDTLFKLENPDPISLDLGPDTMITLGDELILQATTIADVAGITWLPGQEACSGVCLELMQSPEETTTYLATITDNNGCTASDEITVLVEHPRLVYVPNVFSPNGDNINDLFTVFAGPGVESIRSFQVFDRWGDNVFSIAGDFPPNGLIGWDGTFNGKDLLPGVYVYTLEVRYFDEEVEVLKGDITLVR